MAQNRLFQLARLLSVAVIAFAPVAAVAFQPPAEDKPASEEAADTETEGGEAQATDDAAAEPGSELEAALAEADVERGKAVYQRVGICVNCHGWDGAGTGKNPRSPGNAANLRETQLDAQALLDVIRCGIPGTPMPYHDRQAYKDPEVCFGMTMEDFEAGQEPDRGKTFREQDAINLVAYLLENVVGKGEATLEDCEAFFGPGAAGCNSMR
jgi:cytochrome c553